MSQPKQPPISVRIPEPIMAEIDRWASHMNCSRHAAIVRLLGQAVAGNLGAVCAYIHQRANEADALAADAPVTVKPAARAAAKKIRAAAPSNLAEASELSRMLQLGPTQEAPGSRLKKR